MFHCLGPIKTSSALFIAGFAGDHGPITGGYTARISNQCGLHHRDAKESCCVSLIYILHFKKNRQHIIFRPNLFIRLFLQLNTGHSLNLPGSTCSFKLLCFNQELPSLHTDAPRTRWFDRRKNNSLERDGCFTKKKNLAGDWRSHQYIRGYTPSCFSLLLKSHHICPFACVELSRPP